MIRAETVPDSWNTVRQDTAQSVENFPDTGMDFKPAGDMISFGEIADHILVSSHGVTGVLLDGIENMATPPFRETLMQYATGLPGAQDAQGLARVLRESLEQRTAQPADFLPQLFTRFDRQRVTRLEMLQMAQEHELTRRAQLLVYLRLEGMVPAPTRRRMAKKRQSDQPVDGRPF
jgi:hypothetical protein